MLKNSTKTWIAAVITQGANPNTLTMAKTKVDGTPDAGAVYTNKTPLAIYVGLNRSFLSDACPDNTRPMLTDAFAVGNGNEFMNLLIAAAK